jgi:hypothetical protein
MRKTMATVLGLVLIAGFVSGCGGDDDNSSGSSDTTPTTQPDDSGNGDGSNEFSEIVAKASKANIRIVYERDGEDSITIAQDGEGRSAFTDGDTTIYTDTEENSTVSCDGTGADAECTEIPLGGVAASILTGFTQVFTGLVNLDSSVFGGDVSSDTIAGRDARCITFSASSFSPLAALAGSLDGEATICVDEETGFLLKLETDDGSSAKNVFLATEVGEATDEDLTPPVTPETIPDISIPDISIPDISIPE